MEANEVVIKQKIIRTEEHYLTHTGYIDKEDAVVFKKATEKQMLEVVNLHRKRVGGSMGRKGRPPSMARDIIISIPKEVEELVLKLPYDDQKALVLEYVETILRDIKKQHKKADIDFLRRSLQIAMHRDSDHLHFHCQLPVFTKHNGLFNNKLITIDYGKRVVMSNARRKMFTTLKKLQGENIEPMTLAEFQALSNKAKAKTKATNKSWRNKQEQLKKREAELSDKGIKLENEQARLKAERLMIQEQAKKLDLLDAKVEKLLSTAEAQISNGNTQRATKTLERASKAISDTKKATSSTNP